MLRQYRWERGLDWRGDGCRTPRPLSPGCKERIANVSAARACLMLSSHMLNDPQNDRKGKVGGAAVAAAAAAEEGGGGEVLDDESKTLGEHGVEAGSQANAVSQNAAGIEE